MAEEEQSLEMFMHTLKRTGFSCESILDKGFEFARSLDQLGMQSAASLVEVTAHDLGIHADQLPRTVSDPITLRVTTYASIDDLVNAVEQRLSQKLRLAESR